MAGSLFWHNVLLGSLYHYDQHHYGGACLYLIWCIIDGCDKLHWFAKTLDPPLGCRCSRLRWGTALVFLLFLPRVVVHNDHIHGEGFPSSLEFNIYHSWVKSSSKNCGLCCSSRWFSYESVIWFPWFSKQRLDGILVCRRHLRLRFMLGLCRLLVSYYGSCVNGPV